MDFKCLSKEELIEYLHSTDGNALEFHEPVQIEFLKLQEIVFKKHESEILKYESENDGFDSEHRLFVINPGVFDLLSDYILSNYSPVNIRDSGDLYGFEKDEEVCISEVMQDGYKEWMTTDFTRLT